MAKDSNHSEQVQREAVAAAIERAIRRHSESGDWAPCFDGIFNQLRVALDPEGLEQRLKQEQERLRQVLDHAPIGVWHLGPDSRLLFVNRTYCDMVGIPEERFLKATHYREVHDEATALRCMESDAAALAAPGIHVSRERVRSSDGTLYDLEITKERIEDEKGQVVGLIGLSLDVTERVKAEARLETERLRFRHLFQNSPIATWFEDFTLVGEWLEGLRNEGVTDLRSHLQANPAEVAHALGLIRILDVNQAAVTQNGAHDKAELMANLSRLFSEQTYSDSITEFEALWQRKVSFGYESRSRRLDGEELHLIVRFEIPMKEGAPDLSQVVVTGTNITEHRKAEQARAQAESQLRQSQKMEAVGQLAGGIAHDFNNILTAMMIQLDLLSEEVGLRPEAIEGLEELRKNAARASGLTRQLLTFSRRQIPNKETLALDEVVADAVRMLGRTLGEHITIQYISQPGLPSIEADRGMLGQLLLNLALNARDAMPKGGTLTIQTEVRYRVDTADGGASPAVTAREVLLSVRDTGCGMGPEILTHLFEPFFTTKDVGKGTGLGLAMVYGIVRQHGARIEVESQVGQGTTFQIHFPASSVLQRTQAKAPAQRAPRHEKARGTLLVVEDESSVRRMIRVGLARGGFQVLEAENGAKALEVWKQHGSEIDLLLTDLVLPGGIGGLQLAKTLRAERPGLKVVFTSGHGADMVDGAEHLPRSDEYVPKPYHIDVLTETVRRVLGKHEACLGPGVITTNSL